jgi:hypothetical protein
MEISRTGTDSVSDTSSVAAPDQGFTTMMRRNPEPCTSLGAAVVESGSTERPDTFEEDDGSDGFGRPDLGHDDLT